MPLSLPLVIAIYILVIVGAIWLHFWLRLRHARKVIPFLQGARARNRFTETLIEGTYRGIPSEMKIISNFRAPMTIVVTMRASFPVKEMHVYRDRKGNERVFEKMTEGFLPKETTSPEAMENVISFYEKNRKIFSRLFEAGITRISIYPDRAVAACSSSFTMKRQKKILGGSRTPASLPSILNELSHFKR